MKRYTLVLLVLLLVVACAGVEPGVPYPTDVFCGSSHGVSVLMRRGVTTWPPLVSCQEALEALDGSPSVHNWEVIFSSGFVGIDENGNLVRGRTWPDRRVSEIHVDLYWQATLHHELRHAAGESGVP